MARRIVGTRELKARLSAYVRAAAAGETIMVSDRRKRPIALLGPVKRSPTLERLETLEAGGLLRRGVGRPNPQPVRKRSKRSVAAMVVEDRR